MEQSLRYGGFEEYKCGFCRYTSTNYKILVRHLYEHTSVSAHRHRHSLWCRLCCNLVLAEADEPVNAYQQDLGDYEDVGFYSADGLFYPHSVLNYYPMESAYGVPYYGYSNTDSVFDPQNYLYNSGYYNNDFYDGSYSSPTSDESGFIYPTTGDYSNAYNDQLDMVNISDNLIADQPAIVESVLNAEPLADAHISDNLIADQPAVVESVLNIEPLADATEDETILRTSNSDFSRVVNRTSETQTMPLSDSDQIFQMNFNPVSNDKCVGAETEIVCTSNVKEPSENIEEPQLQNIPSTNLVINVELISNVEQLPNTSDIFPVEYKIENSSFASNVENSPVEYISDVKNCSEKIHSESRIENSPNCDPSFALDAKSRPETPETEKICLETERSEKTRNETPVQNISENSNCSSSVEKSSSKTDVDAIGVECKNFENSPKNSKRELETSNVKNSSFVLPSDVDPVSNVEHYRSGRDNKTYTENTPVAENGLKSNGESDVGPAWKDVTNRSRRSSNVKPKPAFVNGSSSPNGNNSNRLNHLSCNNRIASNIRKNRTNQTNSFSRRRNSHFHRNGPKTDTEYANNSNGSISYKDHGKLTYSEVVKFGRGSTARGS